jgi:hypothetical protein
MRHRFSFSILYFATLLTGYPLFRMGSEGEQLSNLCACEHCPVSIEADLAAVPNWIPERAEACQLLSIPDVQKVVNSRWGLGVAVSYKGKLVYTEYLQRPWCIRELLVDSLKSLAPPFWMTRESSPPYDQTRIEELTWDPIHNVLWGASRSVIGRNDRKRGGLDVTRIYTIVLDSLSCYAECTYRFDGLGVTGPNFPTTGLTFDPDEGPEGTLWQHIEDGSASYTAFPITHELGTSRPGRTVYVEGYPGHGLVSGICVSPSGKYMYVSHGHDGFITLHDKLTGALVATIGSGPTVPRRACRGLEIDYSHPGCPRLLCHETSLLELYGPAYIVAYPITDE